MNKLNSMYSFNALIAGMGLLLLSACGGGGGDSDSGSPTTASSAAPAPVTTPAPPPAEPEEADYTPDAAGLDTEANKSAELYVEPDFTFDTHKLLTLDISAINAKGQALANTLVSVSVIDNAITEFDDERLQNKALLTVAKTDGNGEIYRQVEVADTEYKLLIEINALGINNEAIVTIASDNYVSYQFK